MATSGDRSWTPPVGPPHARTENEQNGGDEMNEQNGGDEMAVKDVIVVSVPVSDQDRAKEFYVDKLGFELRQDQSMPGLRWVMVGPKGGGTSLTLVTWFESMPPGSLQGLVLTCDDIQAEYESLVAKGV